MIASRSKLRADYKSDEAAAVMFGTVAMASTFTDIFNRHPELTDFDTKIAPSPEKIVRSAGKMPAPMLRTVQLMATDAELVFHTFMKAYWGGCHFNGVDFKNRQHFQAFCEVRDVDCYLLSDNLVGLGFNHAIACTLDWDAAIVNLTAFDADFFGAGEFTLPKEQKVQDALLRLNGGIDISKLH